MKLCLSLFALAIVSGCAVPRAADDDGNTSAVSGAASGTPTITFDGAWNETTSSTLRSGGKAEIVYDASRLTACRGNAYGKPAWSITGFYRIDDGPVATFAAAGHVADGGAPPGNPVIDLPKAGMLHVWFQNTSRWGCSAWDSDHGNDYRFNVAPPENAPGWVGNAISFISRGTCSAPPCPGTPLSKGWWYDTWARQRAASAYLYFEVWKAGVTDWADPDLWKKLDVQMHYRFDKTSMFAMRHVSSDIRTGNNMRYAVKLREIDPLPGNTILTKADCPKLPLTLSLDGYYVQTEMEFWFTVNGVELRPEGGGTFKGTFQNYEGIYKICL